MKLKSTLRSFLALAGSSLLTITYVSADTYYWDSDGDGTAGFGATAGTWQTPDPTTNKWSTSPTGDGVGGAAVANYLTATTDDLFFGTATVPYSAATTITGTVNANSIYQSSGSTVVLGTLPVVNFSATGSWETTNSATPTIPAITITGAGTSMTWKSLAQSTFNITAMINNGAARNVIAGPGRIGVNNLGCLGPATTPLTLAGGQLRIVTGYASMTALHGEHPITWAAAPVNFGIDYRVAGTFEVDTVLPLGTGDFTSNGAGSSIVKVTVPQTYTGKTFLVSGTHEIGQSDHLGDDAAEVMFGTGTGAGSNGTLKITGTTMNSFGARIMQTTIDKGVSFNIADAANTFTLDDVLNQGTGGLSKSGAGTLTINTTSSYTGTTTVSGGTLNFAIPAALPTGAVTVSGTGASLQFDAYNPSVGVVTLTNGTVTGSGTLTSNAAFACNPVSPNVFPVGIKLGGTLGLNKTGTGTTTLSLDNSGLSGPVAISAGTLNINSTTALGTGTVTISGGTIDATSGPITLSTNNTIALGGGNFAYGGTNALNLGTGPITLSAGRTITLNGTGSTLTLGGVLTNTQAGSPTLTVNDAVALSGNTLVISGGYALSDSGISYTPVINGSGKVTISSAVTNGGTATASGLSYTGTGTLTLNGNNTYDGTTLLNNAAGTLNLNGDNSEATGAVILTTGNLNVNHVAALGTNTVTLTAGTINNTSGSAKALTSNNLVTFGGNFAFGTVSSTSANNLTFGSGAITNAGSRTITLNGTTSTLAFGGVMTNGVGGTQTTTVTGTGNTLKLGGYALSSTASATRNGTFNGTGNVTITGAVTNGNGTNCTLTYSGTGTLTLQGTNTYTGNTTVSTGCLALVGGSQDSAITVASGAFLGFTLGSPTSSTKTVTLTAGHKVRITGTPTVGVTYDLLTSSAVTPFAGVAPVIETPPDYSATHTLVIEGNVLRLKSLSTPFQDWALAKGLDGSNNAKTDDPDSDGKNNNFEFAFNGNPLSGSDNGMIAGLVQDASSPLGNELTLIVAVRNGATFANAGTPVVQTATVSADAVTYTIQGTLDLVTIPGSDVSHVGGPSNTAPSGSGLTADLTSADWKYHTFKLNDSEGLGSKGFLRAKAE